MSWKKKEQQKALEEVERIGVYFIDYDFLSRRRPKRGYGRSFMTKHSRKEQLQSQFEYDPFAKDVDSYGVNVEDVDAPLAPESQTSSQTSSTSRAF